MIYPCNRLLVAVLLLGLPMAIAGSLAPSLRLPLLGAALLFLGTAAFDVLVCWRSSRTLTVSGPEIVRMYRAIECRVTFRLTARRSIAGRLLETGHCGFPVSAPVAFRCGGEDAGVGCEVAIVPLSRGRGALRAVRLRVDSPLSLWRRIYPVPVATQAQVFANNKSDKHLLRRLQSGDIAGSHTQQALGKGREVDKLRDYVPGDSMEDIHWKAMARHGRPITKEYRLERSQDIYAVIDVSRSSKRIVDYLVRGSSGERLAVSLLERSIVAADMLSIIACKQADRIGLAAFDHRVRLFIKPGMGSHHLITCRNALVGLEAGSAPADYREMFQFLAANIRRRAMILILADFDDPFATENFAAHVHLLTKRHMVMGVCPLNENVQPLFSCPVDSQEQIYRALSGHLKWRAMQNVRQAIRVQGSDVIAATPRDLPTKAIEAYATMKRRQGV